MGQLEPYETVLLPLVIIAGLVFAIIWVESSIDEYNKAREDRD